MKERKPLEIGDEVSEERLIAAIRTLVGAAGALRRLRQQQMANTDQPPMGTVLDHKRLEQLAQVLASVESLAAAQRTERAELLHVRLREEIVEAYQPLIGDVWTRGRQPRLSMGDMGDAYFPVAPDANPLVRVETRIRQAWWNYQRLSGSNEPLPERRLALVLSREFLKDKRNRGIGETAQRAAAILARRGYRWLRKEPKDGEGADNSCGRGIAATAADSHYDANHHGATVSDPSDSSVTLLSGAPSNGELGHFFGAGWPVEDAVASVADEAVGHLLDAEYRAAKANQRLAPEYRRRPHELAKALVEKIAVVDTDFDTRNPDWLGPLLGEILARLDEEGWPADEASRRSPPALVGRSMEDVIEAAGGTDALPSAGAMASGDVWAPWPDEEASGP